MKDTYNAAEAAKRIHPSWRTWVVFVAAGALLLLVLAYFKEVRLWRPIMFSVVAIVSAVAVRWDLHHHSWFWPVVAKFVIINGAVIRLVPWNSSWVAAALIAPFVIADALLILATFQIAVKFTPEESSHS